MEHEAQGPINTAARAAAQQLADEHDRRVVDLLKKHELWEEGVQFSEALLAEKGYMLNQIIKPNQEYELVLAKIVETVRYKATVDFNLEVNDMADTTLEDTPERRADRKAEPEAPVADSETPTKPAPAESSEDEAAE